MDHFLLATAANLRLAKDGGSMRFTELGSVLVAILDNNNIVRCHLLHISFFINQGWFRTYNYHSLFY